MSVYRGITGRRFDLAELDNAERAFVDVMIARYRERPTWAEFASEWKARARASIWKGKKVPVRGLVYRLCQDLAARLGIAEGAMSPPDYRDRIADLIEERFRSRYEFCKKTGIDEGHLSRVLATKKHFAPETLFGVLDALGVEIELVERGEVWEQTAATLALSSDEPIKWLREAQRRLDHLEGLRTRTVDESLEEAIGAALAERAEVARKIADDAENAALAHRRARSGRVVATPRRRAVRRKAR